jgi:SSS family solute:Na+ symporter
MAFSDLLPALLIGAYLVVLSLIVIVWGRMREDTMEEYAVAGRSFPWYMMVFTVLATWIVASTYTGWFAWAGSGGAIAFYYVAYTIVALVIYYALAPRVWKWGKLHDLYNMPDFIRLRYDSPKLAVVIAIAGIVIGAPWQVASIKTFGFLMSEATNGTVPFDVGMGIITVIVLGYIVFAGMRSVVITDFIQGVISTFVLFAAVLWIAYALFGGFGSLVQQVAHQSESMFTVSQSSGYWASIVLTGALGGYAWMEVFNRIFLAKNVKEIKKVAVVAPLVVVLATFSLFLLGMGASLLEGVSGQGAFFQMAEQAGGPVLLAGVGIIILAAGMSSIDSQLTTMGVVVSWNVVKELKPDIETSRAVNISRVVIVAWVAVAFGLATLDLPLLAKIGVWTYEGIVHLLPPIVLGLFWRKGNKYAAGAGIVAGMAITYGINLTMASSFAGPAIMGFTGAIVGLPVNLLVFVVGAYLGDDVAYVDDLFDEVAEYDGGEVDVESRERVLEQYEPLSASSDDD